jgi:hypothetical protein
MIFDPRFFSMKFVLSGTYVLFYFSRVFRLFPHHPALPFYVSELLVYCGNIWRQFLFSKRAY